MAGPSPSLMLALAVALMSCASTESPPAGNTVVAPAPSSPPECTPRLCSRPGYACRGGRCLLVRDPPCSPGAVCVRPHDFDDDTVDSDLDEAIREHRHDGPDTY